MRNRFPLVVIALASLAPVAGAQSIAERVRTVHDATVELRFAGRPGLCGDGRHYLSFGGRMQMGELSGANGPCLPGPVRVRIRLEGDDVRDVRTYVGPVAPLPDEGMVVNVGVVPAAEAAAYFLQLAGVAEGKAGTRAVLPAVLADSASVWRGLVRLARDAGRPRSTRVDAGFWLSRFAASRLAGHGESLVEEERDHERGPREEAVFALSQLRNGEGIPALLEVARTNRDPSVRREALFWLGQSGDARGIDLMEEILRD